MPEENGGDGEGGGGQVTEEEEGAKKEEEEEEEEEDSEDEEDSEEDEEVGIALQLPQRATRGHAYQRLIGEALEEDQAFWGHNTWADEEEDDDYNCSEGEEVYEDVIDSDFDRPEDDEESDSSDGGGKGEKRRKGGGRRGEGEASGMRQQDRDKKRKREEKEDEEKYGEQKKTRKQAFELMWKRRQAKREKEERDRREKKKQAKRELQKEAERQKLGLKEEVEEADTGRKLKPGYVKSKHKQEGKQEVPIGEARQLRMTRGRLLRGGENGGSSTSSDEQEHPSSKISKSQKQRKRQQKSSEKTQGRGGEMTLEEHLEEARRTEEKNLAALLAMEERDEARRLRHVFDLKKNMYAGDYDRYFSWASWLVVGDQAAEDENEAAPSGATATAEQQQPRIQIRKIETKQEEVQPRDGDNEQTMRMSSEGGVVHMKGQERSKNTIDAPPATAEEAPQTDASHRTEGKILHSVKGENDMVLVEDGVRSVVNATRGEAVEEAGTAAREGKKLYVTTVGTVQASDYRQETLSESQLADKEEKKDGQDGDQCVTGLSGFSSSETACQDTSASVNQRNPLGYVSEKPVVQQRPQDAQTSAQLKVVQEQQEGTVREGRVEERQQHVELVSACSIREGISPTQEEVKEGVTFGKHIKSSDANEKEERDETQEDAKENEEYAMELRMFTDGKFPEIYMQQPIRAPTPLRCMITGQRAKYRDPLTGAPYATAQAFKFLRESFQRSRKQQLVRTMQQIKVETLSAAAGDVCTKDIMGATQSADGDKASAPFSLKGVVNWGLPLGTSAVTSAPVANNGDVYLVPDISMCHGVSSGNAGDAGGYRSRVEARALEAVNVQSRQRKAAAGAQAPPLKKTFTSSKSSTALGCPQQIHSPAEDDVCATVAVQAWTTSGGAEQKRRRNARHAASCERKVGRTRAMRKLS